MPAAFSPMPSKTCHQLAMIQSSYLLSLIVNHNLRSKSPFGESFKNLASDIDKSLAGDFDKSHSK